jgi:hypothetical protein
MLQFLLSQTLRDGTQKHKSFLSHVACGVVRSSQGYDSHLGAIQQVLR